MHMVCTEVMRSIFEEVKRLLCFARFTQRNILRVYPAGSRVDSSNYNPIMAWNHGAQMVAQNMQARSFFIESLLISIYQARLV